MVTFVLNGQFEVLPAHIENGDQPAVSVVNRDLGSRRRKTGADQKKPQPRLARRLRTRIDKRQRDAGTPDAAASPIPLSENLDVGPLKIRCASERVDCRDSLADRIAASEVESCTGRRRYGNAGDCLYLVVGYAIRPCANTAWRTAIVVEQLGRCAIVDPFGPVQRRCRATCDNASPTGPQPRRMRALSCGELGSCRDIYAGMDSEESAAQRVPRHHTGSDRFATDEWLPHGRSVQASSDKRAQRVLSAKIRPQFRNECTLDEGRALAFRAARRRVAAEQVLRNVVVDAAVALEDHGVLSSVEGKQ